MAKPSGFRFRQYDTIGNPSAESDQLFLSKCFVDTGALPIVENVEDQRSIILGRTGTGKTALLETMIARQERVARIDPHNVALGYISNSTVIRFFEAAGVSMDPFYRFLWKHIFVVEILKLRFDLHNEGPKKNGIEEKLRHLLRRQSHKDAFSYLSTWGTNFIESTEQQIRDVTTRIEQELSASVSLGLAEQLRLGADGAGKLSEEVKFDIHHRGQEVLNTIQVAKLASLFNALDEDILEDPKKHYYIILDRLDENWVDDEMRYRLIRSLIEVMRDFNSKVGTAKVVIALRVDLFDQVLRATTDSGFQGEKYRGLCLSLDWKPATLTEIVDRRVNELVRSRWTGQPVTHSDILPGTIGKKKKEEPLSFMIDRTLMRPRDIIAFINDCLELSAREPVIHPTVVDRAEPTYSERRLRSLADEWSTEYPFLPETCGLMKKRPSSFELGSITDDQLDELCLGIVSRLRYPLAEGARHFEAYFSGQIKAPELRAALAQILYKVGAIGIKPESYNQMSWIYSGPAEIPSSQVDDSTRIYPHKMLWRALGIVG